ncbi:hypothetical protein RRG08_044151, partial [Elysia crispata]
NTGLLVTDQFSDKENCFHTQSKESNPIQPFESLI